MNRVKQKIYKNLMTILLCSGVILVVILGYSFRAAKEKYTSREIMYIGYLGEIFLQVLKGVAIPLMMCCLISSIASLDMRLSGRISYQIILFFLATKLQCGILAAALGIIAQPGSGVQFTEGSYKALSGKITTVDNFLDLFKNIFPSNIIEMMVMQHQTVLKNTSTSTSTDDIHTWDVGSEMLSGVNVLGVITVSISVGIAIGIVGKSAVHLLNVFHCLTRVTMVMTVFILWIAPICIASLVAQQIVNVEDFGTLVSKMGKYLLILFFLYVIQFIFVYHLIYFLLVRKNPFIFMLNFSEALVTAFATSSSLGALPVSIRTMIEKNLINIQLVHFVMPVGANLSKDGSVLFLCISTIFMFQLYERILSFGVMASIVVLSFTLSAASVGVPYGSLINLIIILETFNLPLNEVSLLLAVDWIGDRFQTVVNIYGDAIGCAILHKYNQELLASISVPSTVHHVAASSTH